MDEVNEYVGSFGDWKMRARGLVEKVDSLESEEGEVGKLYSDILQSVYLHTAFYITLCTSMAGFFVKMDALGMTLWMTGFVSTTLFGYIVGAVLPIVLAYRQLSGLKLVCQRLILRREKLLNLCYLLLEEYNQIYVSESNNGGKDDLLKEILSFSVEKLEDFKREELVPKFQKRNNRKIVLVIGVCCSIYTTMAICYAYMYYMVYLCFPFLLDLFMNRLFANLC